MSTRWADVIDRTRCLVVVCCVVCVLTEPGSLRLPVPAGGEHHAARHPGGGEDTPGAGHQL